ncbi:hypothetical protein BMS3Bbin14_00384 [bacterium BMS3Bbin14]|nr:hypothetical protein BMS3Abin13_00438 [bacterium BMS3Abin13]GBE51926.1 hypothetical protein BMS3Bbin14_00384 [bacterium BMS3Bbin14]HDK43198.1 universal stress protein [Desulfobacteraceae bacterium]HDO30606.1 universal stress protein [Desulfobacteraceae bacterium]
MSKALLNLDENLASSIALRYAAFLAPLFDIKLHITHIEVPDRKKQAGTGWVRRTWENGLLDTGRQAVQRLLRTENVQCNFAGSPIVLVGNRDPEILRELKAGGYDLFIEGNTQTGDLSRFHDLLTSDLYSAAPCPIMLVNNLATVDSVALLCGGDVDCKKLVMTYLALTGAADIEVELVYFKLQENEQLVFLDETEGGADFKAAGQLLLDAGKRLRGSKVLSGTPEQTGDYLKNFAFVGSSLPGARSPQMEVLFSTPSTLLLCR